MDTPQTTTPYTHFQAGVTATLRTWSALHMAVTHSWGGGGNASNSSEAKAESLRDNIFHFFDGTWIPPTVTNMPSTQLGQATSATGRPKMTLDELEDNLFDYMEEEFGVILEDGSEREVANLIWRMYEGCAVGDVSLARETVRSVEERNAKNSGNGRNAAEEVGLKSVIQSEMEDDSDEEDGFEGSGGGDAMDMQMDEGEGSMQPSVGAEATSPGNLSMQHNQQPQQMQTAQQQQTTQSSKTESEIILSYATEPLFGRPKKPEKDLPPPRQLGEPEPEKPQPEVDEDGFAMVVTKKKGKKR